MDTTATVVMGGLGAFSVFLPPITDAESVDVKRLRIGQGYAAGATLLIGFLAAKAAGNPTPIWFAVAIIGIELAAWEHARSYNSGIFNG